MKCAAPAALSHSSTAGRHSGAALRTPRRWRVSPSILLKPAGFGVRRASGAFPFISSRQAQRSCAPLSKTLARAVAPNILLILTDDVGFGASSPFGGPITTPTLERLAANGLRYTQFHTTALCSPTRAALNAFDLEFLPRLDAIPLPDFGGQNALALRGNCGSSLYSKQWRPSDEP